MRLSDWLRDEVCGARDWSVRLVSLAHDLRSAPREPAVAEKALALAEACEAIVPSRSTAIEMYVTAWKADHRQLQALARARFLCREIGNLALAAKIAKLEYQHTKNPDYQLLEGLAWLDAQNPDRALRPLLAAAKANRADPVVGRALSIARREWTDVRGEIARLEARAKSQTEPRAAADLLLDAARIAGMLATDETYTRLLIEAFHSNPTDESVHDLLMHRLGQTGDYQLLPGLVEMWSDATTSVQQRVDVYRRVGLDEALMSTRPDLAARMVYEALRIAYRHSFVAIPGHLAMVGRLRTVLEQTDGLDRLLAVIRAALDGELSTDEGLWFAIIGLDVTWNRLEQAEPALPYARMIQDAWPTHSVLQDYRSAGGFALSNAAVVVGIDAMPAPAPAPAPAPIPDPVVPASIAPHLLPDPSVIDLSALGDGDSPPLTTAPIAIDLPPPLAPSSPDDEEHMLLDDDDVMLISDSESASAERAGAPPPPRFHAPGFPSLSKIPNIPRIEKPSGEKDS